MRSLFARPSAPNFFEYYVYLFSPSFGRIIWPAIQCGPQRFNYDEFLYLIAYGMCCAHTCIYYNLLSNGLWCCMYIQFIPRRSKCVCFVLILGRSIEKPLSDWRQTAKPWPAGIAGRGHPFMCVSVPVCIINERKTKGKL